MWSMPSPHLFVPPVAAALLAACQSGALRPPPALPAVTAGAAGSSVDVEYIQPEAFRDPGGPKQIYFPTKFVCGEPEQGGRAAPASYETLINVINLSRFKANIGWFFVTVEETVTGAESVLPSRGSVVMDCEFIRNNLPDLAPEPFVEGFLLIEDLTAEPIVRVVAVYSVLHKQLHGVPDLRPVKTAPSFCRRDGQGRLIVTIENVGEEVAPESVTRVEFAQGAVHDRTTDQLDPGEQVDLAPIPLPGDEGTHSFTIRADFPEGIAEVSETNNVASGACAIIE